jgi:heat shock protein beta
LASHLDQRPISGVYEVDLRIFFTFFTVEFYESITKDKNSPVTLTNVITEGEVTNKSLLFIPSSQPSDQFNKYGHAAENIKLYVRRVFLIDDFKAQLSQH